MKGAGSLFAIVTHFTQKTFPQTTYNAGFLFYPSTSLSQVFSTLYSYSTVGVLADPLSHVIPAFTSVGPNVDLGTLIPGLGSGLTNVGAFCFFYPTALGSGEADVLKPFTQIPALLSTKRDRNGVNSISAEIAGYSGPGKRQSFTDMAIYLDNDPTILQELYDAYQQVTASYRLAIVGYISSLIFYPIGSNFVQQGLANGKKNSMGIEDSLGGQDGKTVMIVSINLTWQNKWQDAKAAECVGVAFAKMKEVAEAKGLYHPFKYMNYANGTQDVLSGYGPASVNRLRQVKSEVDPNNDFGLLVKGRYKLPPV
ncbi:hypothetical protein ABW20_dc0108283 [Dactylellina cionopaga]|nr:hypothetical protein ABW20_dc0108283 [Dactylellina cionopaga]